ncbi:DUF4129 domain-containing protein [Mobilicoccus pelagius]|uniref:Protein-glutamine gamma-glutamyltransferase-like C-terminal domain-containing protein n=1 Tax=Mobilicoccus pelagius NBRC 104925 TaxID=1089455 RepID=H5UU06_9MICO|nr:DUF4129 domain-containing protein [Mobilicoccus pelagius]GAB49214.1 hypothetical protein MOPEL_099_00140 [Mobilicoccus pelagius NBRC 104925]
MTPTTTTVTASVGAVVVAALLDAAGFRPVAATPAPPGAEEARRALSEELTDPRYVRSWWGLIQQWIRERLALPQGDTDLASVLAPALVLLGLLLVGGVVALLLRRRRRPTEPATASVFGDTAPLTAAEHREQARAHLAAGRHEAAVVAAFRAMTAAAVVRHEVRDAPDLTAHEVGRALTHAHPAQADAVRRADRTFAAVRYGGATADADTARDVLATADTLDDAPAAASSSTGRTDSVGGASSTRPDGGGPR